MRRFARLAPLLLATVAGAFAQEPLPRGQLVDRVVCREDPAQSYALYLPAAYTPARAWPVIFCFDPGGRGRNGVDRLREAADRFGYIVAGSNNSRNGPWEPQKAAIVALTTDVTTRFNIDQRRLYAAGLSGGARVAIRVALGGQIRGVIACGAGFPQDFGMPAKVPFALFGTTGIGDMNYSELKLLDLDLAERGAVHRLEVHAGGHEWASAALMTKAVGWFELHAMRTDVRGKDEATIRAALEARVAAIPAAPAPATWAAVRDIALDFKGLADVSAHEKRAAELGARREVKDWQKADKAAVVREITLLGDLADAASSSTAGRMRKLSSDLRAMATGPEDSPDRQMAKRVLASFSASARDISRSMFQARLYAEAAQLLEMMAAYDPAQNRTWYDLARARGLSGDRKGALAALAEAVKAGYANAAQARAEPAFARFRDDAAFETLLAEMGARAIGDW